MNNDNSEEKDDRLTQFHLMAQEFYKFCPEIPYPQQGDKEFFLLVQLIGGFRSRALLEVIENCQDLDSIEQVD